MWPCTLAGIVLVSCEKYRGDVATGDIGNIREEECAKINLASFETFDSAGRRIKILYSVHETDVVLSLQLRYPEVSNSYATVEII